MIKMRGLSCNELNGIRYSREKKRKQIEEVKQEFESGKWTECGLLFDAPPEVTEIKWARVDELV